MTNEIGLSTEAQPTGNAEDREYDRFRLAMNARFEDNTCDSHLFRTDCEDKLWDAYLAGFSPAQRQYHNCAACRHFIQRYGSLVTISAQWQTFPAFWSAADAPDPYRSAVENVINVVSRAKVVGVFLTHEKELGQGETGKWRHYSLTPPSLSKPRMRMFTAEQEMAEKLHDFQVMSRALQDFPKPVIQQAVNLLRSDSLYRSEKVRRPAEWLLELHQALDHAGSRTRNVLWSFVADAPPGFCHPRTSMIGTLLEDIASGMDFKEVSRRFTEKMDPTKYQRPQAAPTAGNIAMSEKLIEKLGLVSSVRRRYAKVDELEAVWRPSPPKSKPAGGGLFSHLKPKGAEHPSLMTGSPQITITFDKLRRTVLPDAEQIRAVVPSIADFAAYVTAAVPEAPPILQWDEQERRNPFSWYLYRGGSRAPSWGLIPGSYATVTAISLQPNMWFDEAKYAHHGKGALFTLEGARDARDAGLALFPETLRAELRAARSTLEAFSRDGKLEESQDATACGLLFQAGKDGAQRPLFNVLIKGQWFDYIVDRWD